RTQKGNSCIEGSKLDIGYAGRASIIQVTRSLDFRDLPNGKKAIGTKCVFRNKKDKRGIVIRNKARLVAQGYTQEEGIDYDKVFAPVARIEAIRLFLAYASFKDFVVFQMDVKSDFRYGKIKEEVYVCQPPGFEDPDFPDRVYKVEKALYRLHQAPRAWYETLSTYLLDNGFQRGKINKTLFIKRYKGDILLVQVYVDDIIFGSTKKELCIAFEKLMHEKFQMSSMGELTFFLGLQVKQKKDGIFISQDKYVDEILKKFRFTEVKTTSTPMETQKPLLLKIKMWVPAVDTSHQRVFRMELELILATVKIKTANGEVQLQALVDGKKIIITESTVRRDLQLKDVEGVDCLANATIFEQLTLMGDEKISQKLTFYKAFSPQWKFLIHTILQCLSSKTTAWNEFSSTTASAIICLATNQKFYFSKYIFDSMVKNLDNAGSANPTDPHHTPTIIQPSTSQPQKKQRPRKPKRKDTQIPQTSGLTDNVADEAVNEEMDDSLERAVTTATSLDAEQDRGNINKTQSMATPNETGSQGTTSGGGPRRQETIKDTIAQTRFENVSKTSNDPLLVRGNTLRSGEDSLKLNKLMELCTNLQQRVFDLETTKTTQANKIASLKRRVKKLESKNKSRTHGLKRLYKVGLTAKVESSGDEEDLGEGDASKQGRKINAIDADEDITLVNDQDDTDMFGVNDLDGDEVVVDNVDVVRTIEETINAAATTTTTTTAIITNPVVEQVKPMKRLEQIRLDKELTFKLQAEEEEEEEERLAREKAHQTEEANIA
ncbi:putative ribonuclease H-like domain-containing protein, partial [Tanacetum coccineum]